MASVAWSVSGKYLASAMEKVVNIWQVNGELLTVNITLFTIHKYCNINTN